MENLNDNNSMQGNRSAIPASLGRMLSEARERLNLSVAEVAAQTKFAPRQIEALEADDFKHLPEAAFLRGFVRSYAKILHLDAQPLLAALPQAKAAAAELIPASVEVPYPVENTSQKQTLILLGAALLLAVVVAGFSVWHFTTPLRQSPSAKLEASVAMPAEKQVIPEPPVQKHNMTASSSPAEAKQQSSATAAQSSVRAAKTKAVQTEPQIHATETKPQTQATETEPQTQATDAGNIDVTVTSTLRLVFGEESWTEIKDKDGKVLSSQINPPGSELLVEGSPPFSMLIGHAASASLFYQGKQVDLKPYINQYSEVAHLKLK
jgi:cytoskeleton protein RodZ